MRRLLLFLLILSASPVWAETAEVLGKGELVMWSSPSGRSRRGEVPPGAEVQVLDDRGAAVKVRYKGAEGWVKGSRLRRAPEPAAAPVAPAPAAAAPAVAPPVGAQASPGGGTYGTAGTEGTQQAPAPAVAAPVAPAPQPDPYAKYDREEAVPRVEAGPSLVTAVGALLLVLALIAGVVYLLRLLGARKYPAGLKAKGIQVLATRPLGPRQALLLVDVGGMPLLLAQSEGMVNLLAEIRDPEAVRRLNDLYGFRETPFEAELRQRLDLESQEEKPAPGGERVLSPEERLAALRRRPRPGEES